MLAHVGFEERKERNDGSDHDPIGGAIGKKMTSLSRSSRLDLYDVPNNPTHL